MTPLQVTSIGTIREAGGPHHHTHTDFDINALVGHENNGHPETQASLSNFLEGLNRTLAVHLGLIDNMLDRRLGDIEEELFEERGIDIKGHPNRSKNDKEQDHYSPIWSMMVGQGKRKKPCVLDQSQEHIVAVTTATLLIGFVAFAMCLVYMLNFPDEQVQSYSFKMMSSVTSIMCAVLVEKAQFGCFFNQVIIQGIFGSGDWGIGLVVKEGVINFVIFLSWVISISVCMKRCRDSRDAMFAANQLLSHEAAFVGIEMIITPQAELFDMKQENVGYTWMLVLYAASFAGSSLLLIALFWMTAWMRNRVTKAEQLATVEATAQHPAVSGPGDETHEHEANEQAHGETPTEDDCGHGFGAHHHGEPHWVIESEEAEEECAAIILSLMTRQMTLFCILGRVPTKKGDFGRHVRSDFGWLFGAIVIAMVLLVIVNKAYYLSQDTSCWKHKLVFLKHYLAFTVAWLALSFSRWSVQMVVHDKTLMFITNAVGLSIPLVLMIVLIDFLCDDGW
eukprot:CAMPEP_0172695608 /NCGR_PEP_ID=MMETSP1074-20121228/27465_1 /TAXON_ID=2916 /ORGANISM="Ceratium fusus, Strain PA161109" /LENGTH=506 /DNA_ID=CAMNT_0013516253 /DNA_START=239 /DNA_END=1756 /DNA_ORIENTATION=+